MKAPFRSVVTHFARGLLALLPLLVSGYVVVIILSFLRGIAGNVLIMLPDALTRTVVFRAVVEVVVIGVLFALLTAFGMLVKTVLGNALLGWMDGFFNRVPILSSVYVATRQVVDIFRSGKKKFFTNPVLAEYPSPGIWAVAFNTGKIDSNLCVNDGKTRYTIFIPTTPNPTSGFLAVMTEDQIHDLPIGVEDAVKMILTGGMIKKAGSSTDAVPLPADLES